MMAPDPTVDIAIPLATYLKLAVPIITATGAAAGVAVKLVLNGSAERIKDIKSHVTEIHGEMKDARGDRASIRREVYSLGTRMSVIESQVVKDKS